MNYKIFQALHQKGSISNESFEKISFNNKAPVSLEWEIKSVLYLSIIVFTYSLATLAYKNIDTIGHAFIISIIGLICFASFYYGFKFKHRFTYAKAEWVSHLYDYIVLLGALSFVTFIAYLQFRYEIFGTRYGLATFITMSFLFVAAYVFDHKGILSLAISNLALWLGITVTPKRLLFNGDFKTFDLVYTGIILAVLLITAGELSKRFNFKAHYRFTYMNFGIHLGLISILSGLFNSQNNFIWLIYLFGFAVIIFINAYKEKSFYFITVATGYFYIGLSYFFIKQIELFSFTSDIPIYLVLFYFIITCVALVFALIHLNKKLNERI